MGDHTQHAFGVDVCVGHDPRLTDESGMKTDVVLLSESVDRNSREPQAACDSEALALAHAEDDGGDRPARPFADLLVIEWQVGHGAMRAGRGVMAGPRA